MSLVFFLCKTTLLVYSGLVRRSGLTNTVTRLDGSFYTEDSFRNIPGVMGKQLALVCSWFPGQTPVERELENFRTHIILESSNL